MDINRRKFLTGTAAGSVAAAATCLAGGEAAALQREAVVRSPEAQGLLYDSTLCVGCKACVSACKQANRLPPEQPADYRPWNEGTWDSAKELSATTYNIIKVYQDGKSSVKDRETDGFAFVKRQCLHCVDPSCVSACPVSANTKDATSGIVRHNPDLCIGCRYCVFSCPFGVPKYEYNSAFGEIKKCQLCSHRLAEGQMPACADVCPTGATLFGKVPDLKAEAERRLALKSGETTEFPRGDLNKKLGGDRMGHEAEVKAYQPRVYGATELGGTQVMYLAAVPFDKLGFPTNVPDHSYASESEGIQHTLYKGMAAPVALLAGLVGLAWRSAGKSEDSK